MKFETINNTLCRMVEPEPLTKNAQFPCVVRLIQDDSRMGMYNRDTKPSRLSDIYLVARIVGNSIVVDEFMESEYHRFEIIGYPVDDGSAEWALWQMEQGRWVINPSLEQHKTDRNDTRYLHAYGKFGQDIVVKNIIKGNDSILGAANIGHWTNYAEPIGWQLYEEPAKEPKPPKEPDCIICKRCGGSQSVPNPAASNTAYTTCPKCGGTGYEIDERKKEPAFAVGDWVEYTISGNTFSSKVYGLPYNNIAVVASRKMGLPSVENIITEQITRKLDPSQVVIRIGCLEGTVKLNGEDCEHFLLKHSPGRASTIRFDALDTPTRELVESLLRRRRRNERTYT